MDDNDLRNTAPDSGSTGVKTETIEVPFKPDEEPPYIFISYAHADRDRIFPIIKRIYEKGWRVWYDEGLPVGKDYFEQLERHIKNSASVLLFITTKSIKRTFVTRSEVQYAIHDANKRIILCYLDDIKQLPEGMNLALADRSFHPRIKDAEIERTLENIEGLKCFKPRTAVPYTIDTVTGTDVIGTAEEGDEYDFEKCEGGIRLTNYKGNNKDVTIPEQYKGQPVVELYHTFYRNSIIEVVHVPPTVKYIREDAFYGCMALRDVYIPASVLEIDDSSFWGDYYYGEAVITPVKIHCAENSAAYNYARSFYHQYVVEHRFKDNEFKVFTETLDIIIDPALDVAESIRPVDTTKYAFCSYADDKKSEAERIIKQLTEKNCSVVDFSTLGEADRNKSFRNAQCLVAFISREYISKDKIDYLYRAIEGKKEYIIYALDNTDLPSDINISKSSEQQLRFDKNEETELSKLVEWLDKNNCRSKSADIPDYEYTRDKNGNIILTKYTGSSSDVVIPREYAGYPIVSLKKTFSELKFLSSVTIPDSVTSIGDHAFQNCCSLKSVTLPESVTRIGDWAFFNCSSLKSVTIPESVTRISDWAFKFCENLIVYCPEGSTAWKYCEENSIPHKPLKASTETVTKQHTTEQSATPATVV